MWVWVQRRRSATLSAGRPPAAAATPPCAQGFLSPASRGSLLTAALVMYLLLSVAAGYSAVWLWGLVNRSFEGWFKVCWRVACFFPGVTVLVRSACAPLCSVWGRGT